MGHLEEGNKEVIQGDCRVHLCKYISTLHLGLCYMTSYCNSVKMPGIKNIYLYICNIYYHITSTIRGN